MFYRNHLSSGILPFLLIGAMAMGATGCASGGTAPSAAESTAVPTAGSTETVPPAAAAETDGPTVTPTDHHSHNNGGHHTDNNDSHHTDHISLAYEDIRDSYTPEELAQLSTHYYFYASNEISYSLNGLGMNTSGSANVTFHAIHDVITGEVAYYSAEYRQYSKEDSDYYNYAVSYSRLYSADGVLLIDWTETVYSASLGSWIPCHTYFDYMEWGMEDLPVGHLLNVQTGETIEGISYLNSFNSEYACALNSLYQTIAILDRNGNLVTDLPMKTAEAAEETYYSTYKDYVTLYNSEPCDNRLWVYDSRMNLLGYAPSYCNSSLYGSELLGPYIQVDKKIYDPTTGDGGELTPIFECSDLLYFDGEIAVCSFEQSDEDPEYYLSDAATGELLAGPYRTMAVPTYDGYTVPSEKAQAVYAGDGATLVKLDRKGNVLAECRIPGICNLSVYRDSVVGYTEYWSNACLLDSDLNEKIPLGVYTSISPADHADDGSSTESRWIAHYSTNSGYDRTCLITDTGEILVDGFSEVSTAANHTLSVNRGRYYGVMDLDGGWIYKIHKSEFENND